MAHCQLIPGCGVLSLAADISFSSLGHCMSEQAKYDYSKSQSFHIYIPLCYNDWNSGLHCHQGLLTTQSVCCCLRKIWRWLKKNKKKMKKDKNNVRSRAGQSACLLWQNWIFEVPHAQQFPSFQIPNKEKPRRNCWNSFDKNPSHFHDKRAVKPRDKSIYINTMSKIYSKLITNIKLSWKKCEAVH